MVTKTNEEGRIEEELLAYVSRDVIRRKVKPTIDAPLVQSGFIDSLGLLQIVSFIEGEYGVNLADSGGAQDFRSIASLAAAVCRIRSARAA